MTETTQQYHCSCTCTACGRIWEEDSTVRVRKDGLVRGGGERWQYGCSQCNATSPTPQYSFVSIVEEEK